MRDLHHLVDRLGALPLADLVFVLSRALPRFEPYGREPHIARSGFFLGAFAQKAGRTSLEVVAWGSSDRPGPDWGLCQRAPSEWQGVDYVSNEKDCRSPITGDRLDLS